jgi:DNA-binding transcriptional MocR family regulator
LPAGSGAKIYKHVIYAVPTFSNPSFKTMSLRRREQLVRVAREYDALVITDDVYDFLQWPSSATTDGSSLKTAVLPRIVDVDSYLDGGAEREGADGFGNAASNGSFSKICGPGLRTGWMEGTAKLANAVSQV